MSGTASRPWSNQHNRIYKHVYTHRYDDRLSTEIIRGFDKNRILTKTTKRAPPKQRSNPTKTRLSFESSALQKHRYIQKTNAGLPQLAILEKMRYQASTRSRVLQPRSFPIIMDMNYHSTQRFHRSLLAI